MPPEVTFSKWLKRNFPDWDIQRIETTTGAGIPDAHIAIPDEPLTIELWAELKTHPITNVQLRKQQYAWLNKRASKGGNAWVFNRDPKKRIIQAWKAPFRVTPGRKDHVKIVSEPTIQLVEEMFKHLRGREFIN